jgi:hypothetical protein
MTTTISKLTSAPAYDAQHALCRKWCDWCASNGGTFSIDYDYSNGNYKTIYTINWPEVRAAAAIAQGDAKP